MPCVQAKVRFDSVHVVRAEDFSFFGEPGANAEWYLTMRADAGGAGGQYTWVNEYVKDNKDYTIGHDVFVGLPNENASITVRASGYEQDDTSANDDLPPAEYTHTSISNWSIGATGKLYGSNEDMEYELYYTITCAVAEGSSPLTVGLNVQPNWRWCKNCQGLWFAGRPTAGVCPAGNGHSRQGSGNYTIVNNEPTAPGQHTWRWCNKCNGMFFRGHNAGKCPASGGHNNVGSGDYALINQQPSAPGQHNWLWCNKCQGLWFSKHNAGKCPAGNGHNTTGSGDYALEQL
jgi:hypothetical protein